METVDQSISNRIASINSELIEISSKHNALTREILLDAFQALYDECSLEALQKNDINIAEFVEKYKYEINKIQMLRVNKNDFDIRSLIGRGHFGEVHMVKEKQTGDIYAMKTIRKCDCGIKRTSFSEERNIMAIGTSPWLTRLIYAFQDTSHLFLIMEYHPGGDLLSLLNKQGGTLSENVALFYMAELTLALLDVHKMGFVHRDVKPDNILLDRCGHVKLADFGSAAKLNSSGLVNGGPPVGTPDYIAPEVLQSLDNKCVNVSSYGVSCDFWSMGIVAYELTIGHTPFTGQNTTATYSKIMNYKNNLKFPSNIILSPGYISLIKALLTDQKRRIDADEIKSHVVFKNVNFYTLHDRVPPYIPKLLSADDTSNFMDVPKRRMSPNVENFKKRFQFSGYNLPFIGFTFIRETGGLKSIYDRNVEGHDQIKRLNTEIENLRWKLVQKKSSADSKEAIHVKLDDKTKKMAVLKNIRNKLERDLASKMAELTVFKRTLELERKDRFQLEKKALLLIKSAKSKWESTRSERLRVLELENAENQGKLQELTNTNIMLNKQLEHALQDTNKQKLSFEKVHNFSRKSVIGLETRLENITSESQKTIAELQLKLSSERQQRLHFENQISIMKSKENKLIKDLEKSKDKYNSLQIKISNNENIVDKLREKLIVLEEDNQEIDGYKLEISDLKKSVNDCENKIQEVENKNRVLLLDKEKLLDIVKEYEQLKLVQVQNDKRISGLENELLEAKERNTSLQKELQDSNSRHQETQAMREMRTKLWRIDKDFGNCKVDKRILERELNDANKEVANLRSKLEEVSKSVGDEKMQYDSALLELSNINETISLELLKLKDSFKKLEGTIELEKEKVKDGKTVINKLKKLIHAKDEEINELNCELNNARMDKAAIEKSIFHLDEEKNKLLHLVNDLQCEKMCIRNELENTKRDMDNNNLNSVALREACTILENQVIEYEKLNAEFQSQQLLSNENIKKLVFDLCEAKEKVQSVNELYNKEKSCSLLKSTEIKRLHEEIKTLQNECLSYKEKCLKYKTNSNDLCEKVTQAEEKIMELKLDIKSYKLQIEDCISENSALKEEISAYISQLDNTIESNYMLGHKLQDLHNNEKFLMEKIYKLEKNIDEKNNYFMEREHKSESTIKQQSKLISYLQTMIDEHSQKKKTISDILFRHSKKENQSATSFSINCKDLNAQLLKERQANKELREQLLRIQAKQSILEVGIHRFDLKKCSKKVKCGKCNMFCSVDETISVCEQCGVSVHTDCSKSITTKCNIPENVAQKYREKAQEVLEEITTKQHNMCIIEGWIKVPGKLQEWENRFARITNDYSLQVFNNPPNGTNSELLETVDLKPTSSHMKVIADPKECDIDVMVPISDLPFVLQLEFTSSTTCWPSKYFLFMVTSVPEREKWLEVLQNLADVNVQNQIIETVYQLSDNILVNCIMDITETINLLGTEKGLYSFDKELLLKIDGLSKVHQIGVSNNLNVVVMIVNETNSLISCDLNHLINLAQCSQCLQPTLIFKMINVNGLTGFHILQVSSFSGQNKICVATPKQIAILSYDFNLEEFVLVRILDTAEPSSTILFTENSLIVGADKFFEIDLKTLQAEEFLDISDVKFKQLAKCIKMKSFPLAIVQVNTYPKEYLLCFNEFSIFVDEYGQCSRDLEIPSTHLPAAFHFVKPFLIVVQFAAIEIIKINEKNCDGEPSTLRIALDKVRFLGANKRGIYFCHDNSIKFLNGKKIMDSDRVSVSSKSDDSDRFSFTSSMVQSLDDHLTDLKVLDPLNLK